MTNQEVSSSATFICGHPKSGTSLVMTLLDSHPQLVVYPEESSFFRRFTPSAVDLPLEEQANLAEDLLIHIFQWDPKNPHSSQTGYPDRDYTDISYEQVKHVFHRQLGEQGLTQANILTSAILGFGEVSNQLGPETRRWVEKTPYNEHFAERIFALWPSALCIHIVRDPRDNFASYLRKHPNWEPEIFATTWRNSTRKGWENRKRYGRDRYLMLRYEDLVKDVEGILETLRNFIGIDDAPILRQPTRNGVPWGGNSMFGERFSGVSSNPIGRYRKALEPSIVTRLEAALFPEMRHYGYPLEGSVSTRARLGWIGFRLRRAIGLTRRRFRRLEESKTQGYLH